MTKTLKRKFPCALCKEELIATRTMNGWLKTCGCGSMHTTSDLENSSWFEVWKE